VSVLLALALEGPATEAVMDDGARPGELTLEALCSGIRREVGLPGTLYGEAGSVIINDSVTVTVGAPTVTSNPVEGIPLPVDVVVGDRVSAVGVLSAEKGGSVNEFVVVVSNVGGDVSSEGPSLPTLEATCSEDVFPGVDVATSVSMGSYLKSVNRKNDKLSPTHLRRLRTVGGWTARSVRRIDYIRTGKVQS
jgi:hypothetical protein